MPISARPLRIAMVSSSFAPHVGGVEVHVEKVARRLAALAHNVEVWTVDRGEHLAEHVVDGITVRYLPTPLPARSPSEVAAFAAKAPVTWRRWVRAHREFQPDVLHVQCFGPNGLYALALHHRFRTPLMVSSHGETFADDHAVFDKSRLLRAGLQHALTRAFAVSGCSRFVLNQLTEHYGLASGTVVPNGVEPIVEAATNLPWSQPYVFAVGRLGKPKGFDLLMAAYAASSLPGEGVHLVIGGDGPERGALQEQRHRLGLDSMIALPGRLLPEQVAAGMAGAETVVVPSRVEAFGIVALETWRSRVPLIMTSRGGGPELVRDRVDGLLVDPADEAGLATELDRLFNDQALAAALSEAGHERVRAFTWDATAAAYDRLYSAIPVGSERLQ